MASFPASNEEFVWMSVAPVGRHWQVVCCERRFGLFRLSWVPAVTCCTTLTVPGSSCTVALLQILASAGNGDLALSCLFTLGWPWQELTPTVVTLQRESGRKPQLGGGFQSESWLRDEGEKFRRVTSPEHTISSPVGLASGCHSSIQATNVN